MTHPVGKSFVSNIEAEKSAFSDGTDTDTNKNPATSIIGQKPEMEGR